MKFCHDDRALMPANQSMGREKREERESDRNLSAGARKYQKVPKFASPHKSPNHMWNELQKVRLERRRARDEGGEIGTILRVLWLQGGVVCFAPPSQRAGGKFRLCDTVGEFLRRFSVEGRLILSPLSKAAVHRKLSSWLRDLEPERQEQAIKRSQRI